MAVMEVIMTVHDPPAFGEIRQGWYQMNNEWWLTRDAVLKEFKLTSKQLSEIVLTTRRGKENEGRLRTTIGRNRYNNRAFVLYSLDDMTWLYQELRHKEQQTEGLLP